MSKAVNDIVEWTSPMLRRGRPYVTMEGTAGALRSSRGHLWFCFSSLAELFDIPPTAKRFWLSATDGPKPGREAVPVQVRRYFESWVWWPSHDDEPRQADFWCRMLGKTRDVLTEVYGRYSPGGVLGAWNGDETHRLWVVLSYED